MGGKIIFFDIDDTLIDSSNKLGPLFYLRIADQIGISVEKIIEIKNKYRLTLEKGSDYWPSDLLNFICGEVNMDSEKMLDPFNAIEIYKESVFPEIHKTLEKLSKNYTLGIFSEGFEEYQLKKIGLSGLIKYFDKKWIFVERRKLSVKSISKIPAEATVIDDKKEVIEQLKSLRSDLKLVWINRNDSDILDGITTIKNLDDLQKILV